MATVEINDDGTLRIIAINRPERRNALDFATLVALRRAVAAAKEEPAVRAVVLTGRGGAFSSGADVREWAEKNAARAAGGASAEAEDWVGEALLLMQEVFALPKPAIAMIDGAAVGAGLDLALCCDFRFASERGKFVCAYTRVGYPPDAGSSWLLPRLIGIERAKRFVYIGELWDAATALEHGLITELHPAVELEAATLGFARRLAAGPTVAQGLAKALLDGAAARSFSEQLLLEQKAGKLCRNTEDHKEGLRAANERREPVFRGR